METNMGLGPLGNGDFSEVERDMMDFEMNRDDMQMFLTNLLRQLALIPTEQLEKHLIDSRNAVSYAEAIGPILDPTGYRDALYGGQFESAKLQEQMVDYLLKVRKLIDQHEALREKYARKNDANSSYKGKNQHDKT